MGSPKGEGSGSREIQKVSKRSMSTIGHHDNGDRSERKLFFERIPPPLNQRKDLCIENWKNIGTQPGGKKTFLDDVARDAKKKLSPVLYAKVEDWAQMSQSKLMHGHGLKNKFLPGSRQTVLAEAIVLDKRRNIPAPGAYNNLPKERVLQVPKTTDNQIKMNDHCKYIAQQTPAAQYDHMKFATLTKPKIFQCKMFEDKKAHIDKYKIVKSKDPDIGTYEGLAAFKRTQTHGLEQKVFMSKVKREGYLDHAVRAKRHSLGPGHYAKKNIEDAYKRLSVSPMSMRVRRH